METIRFLDNDGVFEMEQPENYSYLYFPIAGEKGLKSCVTPNLGGDSKINQESFLLEPVSSENLHNNRATRNFWCIVEGVGCWSATGASAEAEDRKFTEEQDESTLTAGLMWQTVRRRSEKYKLEAEITSFVPVEENVEVMHVVLCNRAETEQKITPVAAVPIYAKMEQLFIGSLIRIRMASIRISLMKRLARRQALPQTIRWIFSQPSWTI